MGGWSGGVYTRFRNWVTDKANSINPQAALFDQEDDGFAAGLNNCVTKDGLNKPSTTMDWNGQDLINVKNLSQFGTGTVSFIGGKLTGTTAGVWAFANPSSGTTLSIGGVAANLSLFALQAIEIGTTGIPQLVLNSTGVFGYLQNDSANTWSLSYGTVLGTLGPPVIQWDSSNNAKVRDAAGVMQKIGFLNLPQNLQNGSPYTLVAADAARSIFTAVNITIPANASVAFDVGSAITFVTSSSAVTIAITSDTLTWAGSGGTTGTRTLAAFSMATILKTSSTGWMISGAGLS